MDFWIQLVQLDYKFLIIVIYYYYEVYSYHIVIDNHVISFLYNIATS
jgi:hypothetical protein